MAYLLMFLLACTAAAIAERLEGRYEALATKRGIRFVGRRRDEEESK